MLVSLSTLKTILNGFLKKINEKADKSEIVQPDWNTAEGEPGHVLNRTHYEVPEVDIFDENITLKHSPYEEPGRGYFYTFQNELSLESGKQYRLTYDCGSTYRTVILFTWPEDRDYYYINANDYNSESDSFPQGTLYKTRISVDYPTSTNGRLTITSLGELKTIDPKYLPDSVKAQPDWNQNDETASDYVKNRTHYDVIQTVEVNETCNVGSYCYGNKELADLLMSDNDLSNITVTINGTKYALVYDNYSDHWNLKDGGNYSIYIDKYYGYGMFVSHSSAPDGAVFGTATFTGYYEERYLKRLDPKYIKDMYYTETVQKSETREFIAQSAEGALIVDLEFAKLLQAHRDTAKYYDNSGECTVGDTTDPISWKVWKSDNKSFAWTVGLGTDPDGNLNGDIFFGDGGLGMFGSGSITVEYDVEEIHTIDPKYIPTPDWNQNDETASGYIKNRPFYEEIGETIYVEEQLLALTEGNDGMLGNGQGTRFGNIQYSLTLWTDASEGTIFTVYYNGVAYTCAIALTSVGWGLGNFNLYNSYREDSGEPFFILHGGNCRIYTTEDAESCTLKITKPSPIIHTLDTKYLPKSVATITYVDTAISAIPTPDVSGQIEAHNTAIDTHADIREALAQKSQVQIITWEDDD